jgi:hypothetical protein
MSYLDIAVSKNLADVFFEHRPKKLFGRGSDHHRPKELHMCFWSIQSHQKQGGMC